MSRLTRDGTAEPVSRDQILRRERGQENIIFLCSADHEQGWQPYPVDSYSAICVVVIVVSHIQRIGCQPEKTIFLHGGESRSWSAEQVKIKQKKKSGSAPPPTTHAARSENTKKIT